MLEFSVGEGFSLLTCLDGRFGVARCLNSASGWAFVPDAYGRHIEVPDRDVMPSIGISLEGLARRRDSSINARGRRRAEGPSGDAALR